MREIGQMQLELLGYCGGVLLVQEAGGVVVELDYARGKGILPWWRPIRSWPR
jgi:fructose-1,6-bisphosphatase/inositol monophosphatase family enzyme